MIFVCYIISVKIQEERYLMDNNKRDNFKRISEQRVNEIIDKIVSLQNLTNKSFYEYDYKDIEKIVSSIQKELDDTLLILKGIKRKGFNL